MDKFFIILIGALIAIVAGIAGILGLQPGNVKDNPQPVIETNVVANQDNWIKVTAEVPKEYQLGAIHEDCKDKRPCFRLSVEILNPERDDIYAMHVTSFVAQDGVCVPSCPSKQSDDNYWLVDGSGQLIRNPYLLDWSIDFEKPGEYEVYLAVQAVKRLGEGKEEANEFVKLIIPITVK